LSLLGEEKSEEKKEWKYRGGKFGIKQKNKKSWGGVYKNHEVRSGIDKRREKQTSQVNEHELVTEKKGLRERGKELGRKKKGKSESKNQGEKRKWDMV